MALISAESSTNRWIDLDTPLDKGDLVAERVSGTETLGRSFEYELIALSEKSDIPFDDLLGHHVTVGILLPDATRRVIDGRVVKIALIGTAHDGVFRYRLLLRPWTWMLTRTTDCKIFQELSVPEIIEAVFADHGDTRYELRLNGSYAKRNYCVQYRETDFNFVSRLMEEEGIYYFFEHSVGEHKLIICDAGGAHESIGSFIFEPEGRSLKEAKDYVREFAVARQIQPGNAVLRDYDFERPSVDLTVKREQERPHSEGAHEVFDYPGEYLLAADGQHLVQTRLEELQAAHEIIEGNCDIRSFRCGALCTLSKLPRADQNRDYLIVSTRIRSRNNEIIAGGKSASEDWPFDCHFELIPGTEPYRAPRQTPQPIVQGPQTAVIVGPAGEEIFTDKYGRVKVQFHWDRYGKKDDKSSCWVRVSQIWAGKNWGWMSIPRIGQEVVVNFLEGDPDQPLITGRVYNAKQMPPWALPDNKTQSGILTRSTPGGSPATANELRFEDKKGSEQVFLHAEKNQDIEVENDETHWVGHDRKKTVDNDENVEVKNNRTEKVGVDETITIGSNRTEDVGVDETITIGANRTESVGADETIDIGANRTETVAANESVTVGASRTLDVGASESITIGASRTETISGSLDQTVIGGINITTPAAMKVTATGGVTFTAPGGFTVIAPGGTKTIDSWFTSIGGKDEDLFSVSTSINTIANSISISNNAYAAFKIDTVSVLMEAVAIKNAVDSVTIQAAATEIKSGAIALYKKAMTLIG